MESENFYIVNLLKCVILGDISIELAKPAFATNYGPSPLAGNFMEDTSPKDTSLWNTEQEHLPNFRIRECEFSSHFIFRGFLEDFKRISSVVPCTCLRIVNGLRSRRTLITSPDIVTHKSIYPS